jgi:hypothetical protein
LHALPSPHGVPAGAVEWPQPDPALHVSVVHPLSSSQSSGVPVLHTAPWQVSAPLQTVVSAHAVPFGTLVY